MARQITLFKIGTILTYKGSTGMIKRYDKAVYPTRTEAVAKVDEILNNHIALFNSKPNEYTGWYVDEGKVVSPDTVKRYIISEYTQTLYGE